jgi:hypothetical protein
MSLVAAMPARVAVTLPATSAFSAGALPAASASCASSVPCCPVRSRNVGRSWAVVKHPAISALSASPRAVMERAYRSGGGTVRGLLDSRVADGWATPSDELAGVELLQ